MLYHHDATVGIEFEPVTDEEQRRIQSGIRQMGERRDRMIRRNPPIIRLIRRIRNRGGYGKIVFTGILIGRVWSLFVNYRIENMNWKGALICAIIALTITLSEVGSGKSKPKTTAQTTTLTPKFSTTTSTSTTTFYPLQFSMVYYFLLISGYILSFLLLFTNV